VPITSEKAMARTAASRVARSPVKSRFQTRLKFSLEGSISGPHFSIENWSCSFRRLITTQRRPISSTVAIALPIRARRRARGPGMS
jgi:hypothetical protein